MEHNSIADGAFIKWIMDKLRGDNETMADALAARNEEGSRSFIIDSWEDQDKISDETVAKLKTALGTSMGIRPNHQSQPSDKYTMCFHSKKVAYPNCPALCHMTIYYNPETKEAYYTEYWQCA